MKVRSQFMAHHQFMAQFCDCPIKCVYNFYLCLYLLLFDEILNHRFMAQFQWHHFVTILSQLSILSPFFTILHHFFTIYDETTQTIQQQQYQSSDRGIAQWDKKCHFCHWIYQCFLEHYGSVISNDNWCMQVFCSCTLPIG